MELLMPQWIYALASSDRSKTGKQADTETNRQRVSQLDRQADSQ